VSGTLTIPPYVSVAGTGAQAVIVQRRNVSQNATLIEMGMCSRLENITAILDTSGAYNLTGVHFPTGTSTTAKLRTCILSVTSTSTSPCQTNGILSDGSDGTSVYSSVYAVQRSTINVRSDSSGGVCRGIYVHGYNRFGVRDIALNATGAGNNIIGVETDVSGAYASIKTSTIGGTLYDIKRTAGDILLGFTDLRNNSANDHGFSVVTESGSKVFGILGNPGTDTSYNLVPGTITETSAPTDPFRIPIAKNTILFNSIINFTGTISTGVSISLHIYKNNVVNPVYTNTLSSGHGTYNVKQDASVDFKQGDTYYAKLVTVGNPGAGTFTTTIYFY
jgi:hypothetical protein